MKTRIYAAPAVKGLRDNRWDSMWCLLGGQTHRSEISRHSARRLHSWYQLVALPITILGEDADFLGLSGSNHLSYVQGRESTTYSYQHRTSTPRNTNPYRILEICCRAQKVGRWAVKEKSVWIVPLGISSQKMTIQGHHLMPYIPETGQITHEDQTVNPEKGCAPSCMHP